MGDSTLQVDTFGATPRGQDGRALSLRTGAEAEKRGEIAAAISGEVPGKIPGEVPGERGARGESAAHGSSGGRDHRPSLLLLCRCVPDALGQPHRARAWQLLRLAAERYRVTVWAQADGPIHLSQWRAVHERSAGGFCIEPPRSGGAMSAVRWLLGLPAAEHAAAGEALGERFNTVLCTDPSVWRTAMSVRADRRVCDLRVPAAALDAHGGAHRHPHRGADDARRQFQHEALIGQQADTVLVADERYAGDLKLTTRRVNVLPEAVDLDYLSAAADAGGRRLLVHADWTLGASRRWFDWFIRSVWPSVLKEAPGASVACSSDRDPSPLGALRHAGAVVWPHRHGEARLSVLQAMAMARPTIVSHDAARGLQATPGQDVLAADDESQWVRSCVAALRSAEHRLTLACGARALVERRWSIQSMLAPRTPTATPLRLAA